ncbi:cystatin domain-containing protein [Aeromonas salmonicida]|uniref:cystatin domain-containing protein n=1 Tax=Aeromonas salmonicida TaxID=645 RepID=UPI0038BCA202
MKRILFTIVMAAMLSACNSVPKMQECTPIAGGWQIQTLPNAHAEAALASVLAQMNTNAKLKSIREVRSQVVSGVNYDIEFQFDNNEVWNTRVYQDLKGNYRMTRTASQGQLPLMLCTKVQ